MLLADKNILVTGVLTEASLAFHVAKLAEIEGANVILTSFGRHLPVAQRVSQRLPTQPPIIELDVTNDDDLNALADNLAELGVTQIDGMVHSIAAAAPPLLGGDFLAGSWPDVASALDTSAYSYHAITKAILPVLVPGASIVGITFDSRVAWPSYDWMGVAKAALDAINRYLARDLGPQGIRANLIAAGPVHTQAASNIPGFDELAAGWEMRAPLGWDVNDASAVAKGVVALLSDWFPATTGEIIHVDGGVHAIG